jgi:hypothetical protein
MNSVKTLNIVLGFLVAVAVPAGYWLGSRNAQAYFDDMNFLLNSERNLEIVQNLKALEALRQDRLEETVLFMQTRVRSALQYEAINENTFSRAREYQQKYCNASCLDVR